MNSSAKSRISLRAPRTRALKLLYAMRAGTAATRPAAVLMRASAMPGATTTIEVDPFEAICENEIRMPMTVPKRPMNGVAEAVVARNEVKLELNCGYTSFDGKTSAFKRIRATA